MEEKTQQPLQGKSQKDTHRHKLWEWLGLGEKGGKTGLDLIQAMAALSIPVVAAILTGYVTWGQVTRTQEVESTRKDNEIAVENERAKNQLQAEESRATNEALQSYLDDMTNLMLRDEGGQTQIRYIKELKRARTLSILTRLNGDQENKAQGKRSVLQFVYESGWLDPDKKFFDTSGADFSGADLSDLTLSKADLRGLNLEDADLSGANLQGSPVEPEEIKSTRSLAGTTMPNGSKHD